MVGLAWWLEHLPTNSVGCFKYTCCPLVVDCRIGQMISIMLSSDVSHGSVLGANWLEICFFLLQSCLFYICLCVTLVVLWHHHPDNRMQAANVVANALPFLFLGEKEFLQLLKNQVDHRSFVVCECARDMEVCHSEKTRLRPSVCRNENMIWNLCSAFIARKVSNHRSQSAILTIFKNYVADLFRITQ